MLERLNSAINDESDTEIQWEKTPDEIVEGVETVFAAIKEREAAEREVLEKIWEQIEKLAELAGEELVLPLKGVALAFVAPFLAIGAGYMEAAEEIKRKRSPIAFAEGVAMGVMAENRTDFIREKFWMDEPGSNPQFEYGGEVEQYYCNGALALGYGYGKDLQGALTPVFWADLKQAGSSFTQPGDEDDWNGWRDFYIDVASAFVKRHIPEAYG